MITSSADPENGMPAILLEHPQLGENIGAAARAMANFGFDDLRLVAPRDGWPNPAALATAAGAFDAGVRVRVFPDLAAASADLNGFFAATARPRRLAQPVLDASAAVASLAVAPRSGVVFGPENSGLANETVALAAGVLRLPSDPGFPSLNLAHAVAIICHQWASERASVAMSPPEAPASLAECRALLEQLEEALERRGWFRPPEKARRMRLNLRSALVRAGWTSNEIRSLRGAVRALDREKRT